MISKSYKFFLAFENSFCKDYISEKFFRYLSADVVVVARGSNEYKVRVIKIIVRGRVANHVCKLM